MEEQVPEKKIDSMEELKRKQIELNELQKKIKEEEKESEKVNIPEHFHCIQCRKVFYNPDEQIKFCYDCRMKHR